MRPLCIALVLFLALPSLAAAKDPPVTQAELTAKLAAFETQAKRADARMAEALRSLDKLKAEVADHGRRLAALEARPMAAPAATLTPAPMPNYPMLGYAPSPYALAPRPPIQEKLASHFDALIDFEMGNLIVERVRAVAMPVKPVAETSTAEKFLYGLGGFLLRSFFGPITIAVP